VAPHILVVEDEALLAKAIAATLRNAGMEVTVVHNGEEALEVARRLHPDVILLDVMLPGRSGIDVCATLKTQPATVSIPIIMVSARSTPQDRMRGLIAGAEQYLTKPFSPTELLELLQHVLKGEPGREWQPQKSVLGAMPADQLVIYAEELSQLYRQVRRDHATLEQLHRQLQETARLKDMFFRASAQDLSALLLALQTQVERLSAEAADAAQDLHHLSEVMAQYLSQLIEMIGLTARPAVPSPTRLNLLKMLSWLLQPYLLEAQRGGVITQVRLPENLPAVIADMELIKAALGYLLANARQITAPGGTLTVRAFTQTEEERTLVVLQVACSPLKLPVDTVLKLSTGDPLPSEMVAQGLTLLGWTMRWGFLRYVTATYRGWVRLLAAGPGVSFILCLPAEAGLPADES